MPGWGACPLLRARPHPAAPQPPSSPRAPPASPFRVCSSASLLLPVTLAVQQSAPDPRDVKPWLVSSQLHVWVATRRAWLISVPGVRPRGGGGLEGLSSEPSEHCWNLPVVREALTWGFPSVSFRDSLAGGPPAAEPGGGGALERKTAARVGRHTSGNPNTWM